MKRIVMSLIMILTFSSSFVGAEQYDKTQKMFVDAGAQEFFNDAYGYAMFPTIAKGGFGIGGSYGEGKVYKQGTVTGDTSMAQITIGLQLGGQAFSQIIFFQDKRSFDEFTSGNFEFGAQATAVALTAGISVEASTKGNSAGASGGQNNANVVSQYHKGMAVFTIAKGGLMYEASIGGQKFSYEVK
ncbi:MAG: YSC84-related protein [Psychromonas sp.]